VEPTDPQWPKPVADPAHGEPVTPESGRRSQQAHAAGAKPAEPELAASGRPEV